MDETGSSSAAAADSAALDFASLRAQGLTLIQRLAGGTWTDHNEHDPGITVLEQLCYALSDLGYRAQYSLPDLLARDGADPYASLYTPAQILPSGAVTIADLRKLAIDVSGVKNAWIELVDEPVATYDAALGEVRHLDPTPSGTAALAPSLGPNVSEIRIRGLYRVWIEKSDLVDRDGGAIRSDVARRLHRFRALGEDFQEITVLDFQQVPIAAALEIDAVADPVALLAEVYRRIARYLSPGVAFHTLGEMLERGRRVDQIFEGPLLDHGFIDADELAAVERRTTLRLSDLIRDLTSVDGVLAVKSVHFLDAKGKPTADWLSTIADDRVPRFDLKGSDIRLERRGLRVDPGLQAAAQRLYRKLETRSANPGVLAAHERDLRPQPGRDRHTASYYSIQHQFPMVYGIGSAGLSQSAPPERRAQAKQLQAYLMFYDQLLANHFAQLANLGTLFSFDDESPDSYFSQRIDDGTLGLDAIRVPGTGDAEFLQRIAEDPYSNAAAARARAALDEAPGVRRRNRFLDHLLARFGEQFRDYALVRAGSGAVADPVADSAGHTGEQLARDKRAFLRDYPQIGRERGSGFDYLEPAGIDNVSGLERILRRKLGLSSDDARGAAAERLYVVEHILLRPVAGDLNQTGPLFRSSQSSDPYSLQISVVLPDWTGRFADANFRRFVEQTVREETPAHLTAYVVWKNDAQMRDFEAAHRVWLQRWREHRLAALGI